MLRLITLILSLGALASAAHAQAAAYFEAEDNTAFTYVGSSWVQLVDGATTVMQSTAVDETISLTFEGGSVIIYRNLFATGAALAEICIDALCTSLQNDASADQKRVPASFAADGAGQQTLTIRNLDGGTLAIDAVLVLAGATLPMLASVPEAEYLVLSSGRAASIRYEVTAGEIAIVMFLAMSVTINLFSLIRSSRQ